MQVSTETVYSITFTKKEYQLFYHGIGSTTPRTRIMTGMNEEQAEFFHTLFQHLQDPDR